MEDEVIRYIPILMMILLLACGAPGEGDTAAVNETQETGPGHFYLEVSQIIGVELGDTSYVFGRIIDAVPSRDGGVIVLDLTTMNLRKYGSDGILEYTAGRQGSGPGEFQMPRGIALLEDGRVAVSDMAGGAIALFGDSLDWVRNITGFFPRPPFTIRSSGDSSFVGMLPNFDREEGTMGYIVARMESSPEKSVIYLEDSYPFDPTRIGPLGEADQPLFAAGNNGSVFISAAGSDMLDITGFTADGTEFLRISEDIERLEKTAEELADEEAEFEEFASRMGSRGGGRSGISPEFEPDLYRRAVTALGIDDSDRLWVRLGGYRFPFWNVYGMNGELLFTASLELDDPDIDDMVVRIQEEGAAAWVEDPVTWPRIHIIQLPE